MFLELFGGRKQSCGCSIEKERVSSRREKRESANEIKEGKDEETKEKRERRGKEWNGREERRYCSSG